MESIICGEKVLRIDFNGPLADMKEATRTALEIVTGLIIPKDTFFGTKSEILKRKTLYSPNGPGPRRFLTEKDWIDAKAYIYDGNNFSNHVRPREGVIAHLRELSEDGWEIHIVTSCRGMTIKRLWKWVNFHGVPVVSVHKSRDKYQHYSCSGVVVDDELQHLTPVVNEAGVIPILLFDPSKHSQNDLEHLKTLMHGSKIRVARGFTEVVDLLRAA